MKPRTRTNHTNNTKKYTSYQQYQELLVSAPARGQLLAQGRTRAEWVLAELFWNSVGSLDFSETWQSTSLWRSTHGSQRCAMDERDRRPPLLLLLCSTWLMWLLSTLLWWPPCTCISWTRGARRVQGNCTSQDVAIFPRSFCVDPSSPRLSSIMFGKLVWTMVVSANFHNNCADIRKTPVLQQVLDRCVREHVRIRAQMHTLASCRCIHVLRVQIPPIHRRTHVYVCIHTYACQESAGLEQAGMVIVLLPKQ